MTLLWLATWFIADQIGGHEALLLDPVNAWTATLILAIALDLGAAHTRGGKRDQDRRTSEKPHSHSPDDRATAGDRRLT